MMLVARHLRNWAEELLEVSPVLVIEGARQVGKSTLAMMLSGGPVTAVTMDDAVTRALAVDDPQRLLRSAGSGRLIVDEIQRCPELVLPLKAEVDRDRRPGRFVLTGSANLLRIPGAEDSLAGRAMTVRVHPFTQGELQGTPDDWVTGVLAGAFEGLGPVEREDVVERVVRGGYPPVQEMTSRVRAAWLQDYANRLVERDSMDLGRAQLPILRRLLSLLAAAVGGEVVLERLAEALGVNRDTVGRYLDLLEGLFLVARLPSWSRNLTSRQIRRPKAYLTDTGLVAVLAGLGEAHLASPQGLDHLGPLLENFVVNELARQRQWSTTRFEMAHYRDRNGAEVDIIIESPQGIVGIEVKAASAARPAHFKHLMALRDRLGGEFLAGIVLSCGGAQRAGDRLLALPFSSLWAEP